MEDRVVVTGVVAQAETWAAHLQSNIDAQAAQALQQVYAVHRGLVQWLVSLQVARVDTVCCFTMNAVCLFISLSFSVWSLG